MTKRKAKPMKIKFEGVEYRKGNIDFTVVTFSPDIHTLYIDAYGGINPSWAARTLNLKQVKRLHKFLGKAIIELEERELQIELNTNN